MAAESVTISYCLTITMRTGRKEEEKNTGREKHKSKQNKKKNENWRSSHSISWRSVFFRIVHHSFMGAEQPVSWYTIHCNLSYLYLTCTSFQQTTPPAACFCSPTPNFKEPVNMERNKCFFSGQAPVTSIT